MSDDLRQQVCQIVSDILGVGMDELDGSSGRDVTEGWDSMQHLSIMMEVEAISGRAFSPEELADAATVDVIVALVQGGQ